MGLNPTNGSTAGVMPVDAGVSGEISVKYRRSKSTQGVLGGMKWKNALTDASWSADGVTDEFVSDHGNYEMRRATAPILPGEQQKFLRLEVQFQ